MCNTSNIMKGIVYIYVTLNLLGLSYNQEIEYYPSQSAINFRSKMKYNHKVTSLINDKFHPPFQDRDIGNRQTLWRKFNVTQENEMDKKAPLIKREADPVFHGHPKSREEMWNQNFLNKSLAFDQNPSLIVLLHNITTTYLNGCTPVILYESTSQEGHLYENLLKDFPVTFVHGIIEENYNLLNPDILKPVQECLHFIMFLSELETCSKVLGMQSTSKVVIVARTSQWAVQEFLAGPMSRKFVNLLVIGQSFVDDDNTIEAPYILYTHQLYIDGLGASKPVVLTSWNHGKFSREVDLFPPKMTSGYAGHRFIIAAANQPPFVVRRIKSDPDGGNPRVVWDGIEIRILRLLAERNNFSIEIREPQDLLLGSGDAVTKEVAMGRADVAIAGMYLTVDRIREMDMSFAHSQDCAVFVTLLSTALPRYRAILGPFHWHVWVALTFTYLFAIFPLAFSDKHTLRHLLNDSGEVENMFWYVFGTFTNCFTFVGKNSWSKTDKITTRLLIGLVCMSVMLLCYAGWYWIFTIIITSCYTGSIIAFVTLPIFPETIDSIDQLLGGFFKLGTLDHGGWEKWFFNSSEPKTNKLLSKMELVPSVAAGIKNTTKAFFWNYAFLGSRAELEYIVQANFSAPKSKKAQLHISNECFVPFGVAMGFPNQSLYTAKLSGDIYRLLQSGLLDKIVDEVKWEIQRSTAGKHLAAGEGTLQIQTAEEKGLTLEDTQGMFLLLAAGFLIGTAALISEWMGGCSRKCRPKRNNKENPLSAISRDNLITTPNSAVESEIKIIPDIADGHIQFGRRSVSAESVETLEGQIIYVTDESIIVHNDLDVYNLDSKRSSSVDLDREVREIFEKDQQRRRIQSGGVIDVKDRRQATASKGAFGDHVTIG